MSKRGPSTGTARPTSRAPSVASARPSRSGPAPRAEEPRRRRLSTAANANTKVPSLGAETNINVVVRCRGRSEAEVAEGSPAIVTTESPLSKAITIETSPMIAASAASAATFTTASAYAGGGHPNTRTYPFDRVFGPEADQSMIFNEVADGMLDEVLSGYNCTIFAYGQTGTGKTYTMQGDTVPTPLMRPSHEAGIIPRVLHKLFSHLEGQENLEYAVKCSYIELYNEELRDLLAPEYKDSAGSAIKIFEDSSKKGVTIQGVEESGLRNLKDGLNALAKGTQRRQTAETKLNSESSRSHSIFTLTVHVRETGVENGGEDLLRIGKFNLVDLAGSEAIGRSGAENKRAREAGMINQSLLTLGRVISALVDKGSHIPYRESKLTRLLQDSLGGRTKTCIIATVSPTRSNMEETISTLDYALRAKSIKNKPEVNAHLTKAGLLKEYVGEIERFKAELIATREKNGVYIPEEIYLEMQQNQNRQKSDFDSARQRVAAIEIELKTRKTEFDTLMARFVTTTDELETARESERQLTDLVAQTKDEVAAVRTELDEEKVVSEAYQAGEQRLHTVAAELHGVASASVRDVGGLFDKLGRLTDVIDTNTGGATRFGAEMQVLQSDLRDGIEELNSVQAGFGQVIKDDLQAYAERGQAESQVHLRELDSAFGAFDTLATTLSASIDEGRTDSASIADAILAIKNDVQSSVAAWSQRLVLRSNQMVEDLLQHQETHLSVVGGVLDTSTSLLDAVITAARENIAAQNRTFTNAQSLAAAAADAETARLRAQNAHLTRLLDEEQATSAKLRTDLINNISAMITGFTDAQDARLRSAVGAVRDGNDEGVVAVQAFRGEHAGVIAAGERTAEAFSDDLEARSAAVEKQRGEGEKALGNVAQGTRAQLDSYVEATTCDADAQARGVDASCAHLGAAASKLSENTARRAEAQSSTLSALKRNASEGHQRAAKRVRRDADEVAHLTSTLLASHATASSTAEAAHTAAQARLGEIESATAAFLTDIAIDEPTGTTPRKRAYPIPSWRRTEPRHVLLASYRRKAAEPFTDPQPLGLAASTGSEATICSQPGVPLSRVDSGASIASVESAASARSELRSSTSSGASVASAGANGMLRVSSATNLHGPAPVRSLSSSFGRLPSPKRLTRKHSDRSERDREREHERALALATNVLGEGGNVPRPRRR